MVIRVGIVYCTRNRSYTAVRGCLATSCVVVGDFRLYWWWTLAVTGVVWAWSGFS